MEALLRTACEVIAERGLANTRTVDVAPTVGAFFGVGRPRGGYDGRNRL